MSRQCAICQPLGVPCGQCAGAKEATHRVVIGRDVVEHAATPSTPLEPRVYGTQREIRERWEPMCHGCAAEQRAEKDASHAD